MAQQRPPNVHEIRLFQEKYPDLDLSWMLIDYIEYLELQQEPMELIDQMLLAVIILVPVGLFALIIVCTLFSIG
jgi:hypothetical protein